MRILTETIIRGETLTLELSELDPCPECCGPLELAGTGERQYFKCTSCFLAFRPKKSGEDAGRGPVR